MIRQIRRLTAVGFGVTALLAAGAVPANASSTEGRETTAQDRCVYEEEINLTFCITSTDRRIEVHAPSGVVVMQGEAEYSSTTTHRGETTTSTGSSRYVSVYAWYVDGLIYEANVIKLDGTSTMTFPDGRTCTFDSNFLVAVEKGGYDHGSISCTGP
ncbi:hypothetical protein [Arthrobacter rhizosphaerae]|uniref:hypothetical protein n=1 Tax=Arthrobacter rhizosphaerae TaxID=2855490 RepID=UPI001FF65200|nr:hypothetical protein [Arthrobacter rhizosphaerae]